MRLWKSWILARKDMLILRRRKGLMAGLIGFPLALGIGLPLIIHFLIVKKSVSVIEVTNLLGAFGFFFVIFSVMLPVYISSYSIVGEKIEKSIEPLLSTPTTDSEILMGKYIGAFIPAIISIYISTVLYMILSDLLTSGKLGYLFYPNPSFAIIMGVGIPLAGIYAISFSVLVSGKVSSAQTAYNLGATSIIPFFALYIMGEIGLVSLNSDTNVLIISGGLFVLAVLMYFVSKATFNREDILTVWK